MTDETVTIEYELDQWEWQGMSYEIELDPTDFQGMSDRQISDAIYKQVWDDGLQRIHFTFGDAVEQIKNALAGISDEEDDDE